ncbi:right-handed parallel beta-helix repeat-containing protein [Deltaproteobacteria bacterium]|nr:right-handed parallel beta-helix repeat-containing protein [Deltaproteobacteria bacterium]
MGTRPGYGDGDSGISDPQDIVPQGPSDPVAPVCPGASPDVSASNGWLSSEAALPASGGLYFEFKTRPAAANLNGLVAVGAEDINDFAKTAIAVRFAKDGLVDVRDGSVYRSDVSYAYDPGVWYTVAVSADIATETYDVEIGRCGEPQETLIKGATFRYDANVSDQLSTWAVWSSQAAPLELSTPTWMASGGCVPASCQSLGHECGQPSNGCGGRLNCGGCGSSEACASGFCVDNSTPPPEPTPPPVDPLPEPTPPPVDPLPGEGDPSERPWAHNTGPSNPGALASSGSMTITTDGAVLQNLDITGPVTIDADDVILRNFRINTSSSYGIKIVAGHSGIVIEDGEIYNMMSAGILGAGFTARRLHIHDSGGDGIKAGGGGGPTLVEHCFIEKLGKKADAHADGNQTRGGSNITFRYNNIYMPAPGTPNYPGAPYKANAAAMHCCGLSNVVYEHNWLNGGGYTIYCQTSGENVPGIHVRNNRFGRDFKHGVKSGTCDEWSGNVWDDNGGPI